MQLHLLNAKFSVLKFAPMTEVPEVPGLSFLARTPDEISLVCESKYAPIFAIAREDDWRAFYIDGILDLSLIGVLSKITGILAENKVGLFVVSTFNTDYVLLKEKHLDLAISALEAEGYAFIK